MSVLRVFKPENRLAKAFTALGGKYVDDAVNDAQQELLQVSEECLKHVDDMLEKVYSYTGESDLPAFYRSVRDVSGLAALCNLPDLGNAALSICNLLDYAQGSGRISEEEVKLSRNVLRVMRYPNLINESGRRIILENFQILVDKSAQHYTASLSE
jgi:hypothetical protein